MTSKNIVDHLLGGAESSIIREYEGRLQYHLINEPANVDNREARYNVFATND